ncbi:hypothetical protein SUGI_0624670 [Cryptomeria japonica]|uniref:GRF1-interacting factor 1 n=1 Tax=Cryptomeria japonica TaxID=3369 RepID=UPI0001AC0833|nr:GRF1-interacting factor 1 [Cryptomeria japonica]GLJ31173.1 hypothetical protein SUGI_0624670 [Cryptomeria japonica]
MQQHLMQMQPMMAAAYASNNITTDHIQKYLDENKQLILAIMDNQNLGKLNECAQYQAKLQQNLMYLAAIADSQPQVPAAHAQIPPNAVVQSGGLFMQHQQAQQQVTPQSLMAARSSMLYTQQPMAALHQAQQQQQQQSLHSHLGISSGGSNGLHMLHGEANMGGNGPLSSGGFPDFSRGTGASGEGIQANRGMCIDRGANKHDGAGTENAHPGPGDGRGSSTGGQNTDGSEQSYLKASEEGN